MPILTQFAHHGRGRLATGKDFAPIFERHRHHATNSGGFDRAPLAEATPTTLKVYMPNVAQALVAGGGFIRPRGASRLKITFRNGLPPYSFTLSDGTVVNGTFINPYQMTVTPRNTTDFKIRSLTNACGTGVGVGTANVRVETN